MNTNKALPLVTYAISCYNHESFVAQAIQSIISQTYANIELIIIDDGSTDGSRLEIEKLLDDCRQRLTRFEYRKNQNKGLCASLNEAIEWAQGDYFACLASDDFIYNDKISAQVDYLERQPSAAAVFSNVDVVDDNGKVIRTYNPEAKTYSFEEVALHKHYLPAVTQLIRTNILKERGGYPEDLKIEDWYMWLALTNQGMQVHRLNQVLAGYRRHANNTSARIDIMHKGRLDVLERFELGKLQKAAKAWAYLTSAKEVCDIDSAKAYRLFADAVKLYPLVLAQKKTFSILKSIVFSDKSSPRKLSK